MEYFKLTKLEKKILSKINEAIYEYSMIEDGDTVIVAVSGGVDSLNLLRLLNIRMMYSKEKYKIVAAHIDLGHLDITKELEDYFKAYNYEYEIVSYKIFDGREDPRINCFWCSFNRRMCLFRLAEKLSAKRIALGHHLDDLVETYLLNLLYHGEISTMPPKISFFNNKFYIIRPLIYVAKSEILSLANQIKMKVGGYTHEVCKSSKREFVREVIKFINPHCPNLRINVLRALKRIRCEYLP